MVPQAIERGLQAMLQAGLRESVKIIPESIKKYCKQRFRQGCWQRCRQGFREDVERISKSIRKYCKQRFRQGCRQRCRQGSRLLPARAAFLEEDPARPPPRARAFSSNEKLARAAGGARGPSPERPRARGRARAVFCGARDFGVRAWNARTCP